jgi:hypothetical protein
MIAPIISIIDRFVPLHLSLYIVSRNCLDTNPVTL